MCKHLPYLVTICISMEQLDGMQQSGVGREQIIQQQIGGDYL
jgi:hypothetical protein